MICPKCNILKNKEIRMKAPESECHGYVQKRTRVCPVCGWSQRTIEALEIPEELRALERVINSGMSNIAS